jgi:hypothetical protein
MSPDQLRKLIDLLGRQPEVIDQTQRTMFMTLAGLDRFIGNVPMNGDARIFSFQLVDRCNKFGIIDDSLGREHAMLRLLNALRGSVEGQPDAAAFVDSLIPQFSSAGGSSAAAKPVTTPSVPPVAANAASTDKIKVLIVASNPPDTKVLRIDKELREIRESLRLSKRRDDFSLEICPATRWRDFARYLMDYQPHVLHFSGHGEQAEGLFLESDDGKSMAVDKTWLGGVIRLLKDNLCCVVLNACWTNDVADEVATYIDCVIGMRRAMNDDAAIAFSSAFYGALGNDRTIQTAFELGQIQIGPVKDTFAYVPQIKWREGVDQTKTLCKTSG